MRTIGIAVLAAVGALFGLALAAPTAQAQPCGNIFSDCEIAEETWDDNADEFCFIFPLGDEQACEKMAKAFFDQCEAALKSSLKCWNAYYGAFPKVAKPACKAEAEDPGACNADYKDEAAAHRDEAEGFAEDQLDCCLGFAEDFFFACMEGCEP
jgi:hypothetical protein